MTADDLIVEIVGLPSPESDREIARAFERHLGRTRPGTHWRVRGLGGEGRELGVTPVAACGQPGGSGTGEVDDEAPVTADGERVKAQGE